MKLIILIPLFFGMISIANFKQEVDCQITCNNKSGTINEKDPLKDFIQSLKKAPSITIPYGNKNVLKKFSTQWDLPDNKNTIQNKTTENLNNNYNQLDSFFYASTETRHQLIVETKNFIAQKILSTNFVKLDDGLQQNKKIMTKVSAIPFSDSFKTYSIIASGKQRCNNCEFPNNQIENVLINVGVKNNIIDKLIVSSIVGSDIGSTSKFFFIDNNKIIHIKEFSNDEIVVNFKKYKQYKVLSNGHFLEISKNK